MHRLVRRFGHWSRRYWWGIVAGMAAASAGVVTAVALMGEPATTSAAERPAVCRLSPDRVADVRVLRDGSTVRIARGPGGAILVNGRPCGGATVHTAGAVAVEAGSGDHTLVVDLSGGRLSSDEGAPIRFTVDLGLGDDAIEVEAGEEDAVLAAGAGGIRLGGEGAEEAGEAADPDIVLRSVERVRLIGGAGDDVLTGAPEGDDPWRGPLLVEGGAGDDRLLGGYGDDVLRGGAGDDRLVAGSGDDLLDGGDGEDTADLSGFPEGVEADLTAGTGHKGKAGTDTLRTVEHLEGGAGDDVLKGDEAPNRLEGGPGDDLLTGGAGDDVLAGGPGTDTADYAETGQGVRVDLRSGEAEGHGSDRVTGIERVRGGTGDDELLGDARANVLEGGRGNDRLHGREGRDRLFGGEHGDVVVGGSGADILRGGGGDDSLRGGDHDDVLEGGRGDDRLDGGPGRDTADFRASPSGIAVDLSAGRADLDGFGGADRLRRLENVLGTGGSDSIAGNHRRNVLVGAEGDDLLVGGGGDDTLLGGPGNDTVRGGPGADVMRGGRGDDVLQGSAGDDALLGGAGNDTADYRLASSGIAVDLAAGAAFGDGQGGADDLGKIENVTGGPGNDAIRGDDGPNLLRGGAGADVLFGDAGNDLVRGGPGADLLRGGPGKDLLEGSLGDDRLDGGPGSDELAGGPGNDTAEYARDPGALEVDLTAGAARDGWGSRDALEEIENVVGTRFDDVITGDDGANLLEGGGGSDRIHALADDDRVVGGPGNDVLDGGHGRDVCVGGPGADVFIRCQWARQ